MNYEFLQLLDKAKTPENAKNIEAIKRLYTICEFKNDPKTQDESSIKYMNETAGIEYNGHEISETCYVFDCENGTVRLTLVDSSTVLIEVSPTGTDNMYHVVGKVGIDTEVGEAIKVGVDALNDDTLMESFVGDMAGKVVDFGKGVAKKVGKAAATAAVAASPLLTGCAGGAPQPSVMPEDGAKAYITQEYGVDANKTLDGNAIPTLVTKISEKLAEQAKNNVKGDYSVATVPAAEEAKNIYQMLKTGELDVPVVKLPPKVHKEVYDEYSDKKPEPEKTEEEKKAIAQQNAATAFARGIRQEFHNTFKANGIDELLKELN